MLEVCAYNIQSCRIAERAGAGRIELCADPAAGGTTPSYGIMRYVLENIAIPVFPMIRPRGGDFVYHGDELAIIKADILMCRERGIKGIVCGILLHDNTIDIDSMKRVVEWAGPMQVTCHKAFDRTPHLSDALEAIIDAGCTRVLTSGGQATALEGFNILSALVAQAAGRISIMPGGGVRSGNIARLAETGATEFHSSGILPGTPNYIASEEEIKVMAALKFA